MSGGQTPQQRADAEVAALNADILDTFTSLAASNPGPAKDKVTAPGSRFINFGMSITIVRTSPVKNRWFDLLGNAITVTDLRCAFSIEKDLKPHPNACTLSIWNLSDQTRYNLQESGLLIEVLAGYDGDLRRVFSGDVLYAFSERQDGDWITKIQLGDGLRAYNFARITKTYPSGTTYRTIVQDIATAMNLKLPNVTGTDLTKQISGSVSLHGPAHQELTRFLDPHRMDWSIQEGQLVILRSTDILAGEALVISEDNAMVGSPTYGNPDKKGKSPVLTVSCLPYPEVSPGRTIEVQSRDIHGQFRVEKVKHTGDTFGDDRKTTAEARQVK